MPELQDTHEIARHDVCIAEAGDDGVTISGIAIGEGDVTVGKSGTKKYWSKDALRSATSTLEGQPLVVDHNNTSRATVGNITNTAYEEGVGVLYEATLFDDELAEKIENGLLEVSIRGRHEDTEEMEETEEGAKVVTRLQFENLSIVPQGAAPSNSVEIGPSNDISAEECAELISGGGRPEGAEENVGEEGDADNQNERAELAEVHDVQYDGKDTGEWDKPSLEDFTSEEWEDLSEEEQRDISNHFFYTTSEFPPGSFGELKLPAVTPQGDLSKNGLEAVKSYDERVSDISDEDLSTIETKVERLLEEFEGSSEEEAGQPVEPEPIDKDEDDKNMTDNDNMVKVSEDELSALRADRERLEELQEEQAERSEELSALREEFGEDLEELKERTSVLDEVSRERVEELRDTAEPVIMSGDSYESLEQQVDSIRRIYSEKLAENSELLSAEDVSEKFTVEEMSEKLTELYGEEYEEELSPNPRSQDPEEEELEERAEEGEEAELEEQAAAEQERLRESMFN